MRCKSCNTPFRPAISYVEGRAIFAELCSSCQGKTNISYVNSHDHVLGLDEDPTVIISKSGSIRTDTQ